MVAPPVVVVHRVATETALVGELDVELDAELDDVSATASSSLSSSTRRILDGRMTYEAARREAISSGAYPTTRDVRSASVPRGARRDGNGEKASSRSAVPSPTSSPGRPRGRDALQRRFLVVPGHAARRSDRSFRTSSGPRASARIRNRRRSPGRREPPSAPPRDGDTETMDADENQPTGEASSPSVKEEDVEEGDGVDEEGDVEVDAGEDEEDEDNSDTAPVDGSSGESWRATHVPRATGAPRHIHTAAPTTRARVIVIATRSSLHPTPRASPTKTHEGTLSSRVPSSERDGDDGPRLRRNVPGSAAAQSGRSRGGLEGPLGSALEVALEVAPGVLPGILDDDATPRRRRVLCDARFAPRRGGDDSRRRAPRRARRPRPRRAASVLVRLLDEPRGDPKHGSERARVERVPSAANADDGTPGEGARRRGPWREPKPWKPRRRPTPTPRSIATIPPSNPLFVRAPESSRHLHARHVTLRCERRGEPAAWADRTSPAPRAIPNRAGSVNGSLVLNSTTTRTSTTSRVRSTVRVDDEHGSVGRRARRRRRTGTASTSSVPRERRA